MLACLAFLVALAPGWITAASAQERGSPRLLTSAEGLAIVNAAWEHQQQVEGRPDCSHLVHEIYRLAGFPYEYASSFDLYSGNEYFVRVRKAQPGDLIAWPGHVGLVVDPAENSFYSSVRSGLETENYGSPHWKGYGVPRFYRYRLENFTTLASSLPRNKARSSAATVQVLTVPVLNDKPALSTQATTHPTQGRSDSPDELRISSPSAAVQPVFEAPSSIRLVSRQEKPSRDEVAEAVSELSNASRATLRADDLLQPRLPVVIFDQLRVERVHFKGNRGWAEVRMDCRASLGGGQIDTKHRQEKRRWELHRTSSGWTAFPPLDRVYVPRDVAVRLLAEQLARLAGSESGSAEAASLLQQEAQLAGILNDLLKNR